MRERRSCYAMALCVILAGCASAPVFPPAAPNTGKRQLPVEREFTAADVVKADIDIAAETHVRECLASARLLMEKLYRRNPREWRKGNHASMEAGIARARQGPRPTAPRQKERTLGTQIAPSCWS